MESVRNFTPFFHNSAHLETRWHLYLRVEGKKREKPFKRVVERWRRYREDALVLRGRYGQTPFPSRTRSRPVLRQGFHKSVSFRATVTSSPGVGGQQETELDKNLGDICPASAPPRACRVQTDPLLCRSRTATHLLPKAASRPPKERGEKEMSRRWTRALQVQVWH